MAKNRKNQSAAVRFGPALKALLLCLFIGGSGVGYVWQKNQIHVLAQQVKKQEDALIDLRRRNKSRSAQLTILCSPQTLEARIKQMNLGLVPTPPSQIVRFVEAPLMTAPLVAPVQLAGVDGGQKDQ